MHLIGNMKIILSLDFTELSKLFSILLPDKAFIIVDGDRIIASSESYTLNCNYWKGHANKMDLNYYQDNCTAPGPNLCMEYISCN